MSRFRIKPPEGELLPAEDRLQNALKAIEDRLLAEQKVLRVMEELDLDEDTIETHRQFMQGLDIAWSLVKTESLGRQTPDENPGFPYTKN